MVTSANAYIIEFPSYYGLDLKFSANVTESYSSNTTYATNNEHQQESFQTNLNLGFNLKYSGKKRSLNLASSIQRQLLLEDDEVQIPTETLHLSFINELSEYDKFTVTNSYSHTQLPTTFAEEFGRLKGKYDRESDTISISYTKDVSKEVNINAGYSHVFTWTDLDSIEDINMDYMYLDAIYRKDLYSYRLSYSFSDSGEVSNQKSSIGFRRALTKQFSVDISAGLTISSIRGVKYTNENFSVSFGNEVLLDSKTSASISYSRSLQILQDREGIFDDWRVTANMSREFLKELTGHVSCFYGQGIYLSTDEKDELQGASAMLNYIIWEGKKGQRIDGRWGYTYSQLDSNVDNRDYQRGTLDFGIVAQF